MESDCTHAVKWYPNRSLHTMSHVKLVSSPYIRTFLHLPLLVTLSTSLSHNFTTGGELPAVVAGVVVAFLLLTLLIAGIIVGMVMLRRRAYKRGMYSQRNMRHQQKRGDTAFSRATEGEKGAEVHT